jgi:hypothetical protein
MKGRAELIPVEADTIRALLRRLRKAEGGAPQKRIRDRLRGIGFYITDWPHDAAGFTASDFDDLVVSGLITLVEPNANRIDSDGRSGGGSAA